jgi:hypothetical protein
MTFTPSLLVASLISMPRFKLALTYEEKGDSVSIGAFLLKRRRIRFQPTSNAADTLVTPNNRVGLRRPDPFQFESQMRSTQMLQAEFSAYAEKAARAKAKTPVIQGNSKWHSACSRSSVALERKRT